MLIRFTPLSEGPGPSEVLVGVRTVDGRQEEVVISKRQAQTESIEVGAPLNESGGTYLVELPREAMSGTWRVWISDAEVVKAAVAVE